MILFIVGVVVFVLGMAVGGFVAVVSTIAVDVFFMDRKEAYLADLERNTKRRYEPPRHGLWYALDDVHPYTP